jgi:hypothetical protein
VKLAKTTFEMSLSRGETRVVYLQPGALVLGIRGRAMVVERVDGLGDASFSVCIPLRQGEMHVVGYGGQVLMRATQCSSLRVIPPQPYVEVWRKRWGWLMKAVQRTGSALARYWPAGA